MSVRVYRSAHDRARDLPLVVHVHGGGFVGTAAQSDWINSHLAARLPAVVVSVEHRLLDRDTPVTAAVDDGWDVLDVLIQNATEWGIDPARVAVFGESTGALVTALAAIRARESGLELRAQVLVNACLDLTPALYDLPSMTKYGDSPTLTTGQMDLFCRLAVPEGADPRPVSPCKQTISADWHRPYLSCRPSIPCPTRLAATRSACETPARLRRLPSTQRPRTRSSACRT